MARPRATLPAAAAIMALCDTRGMLAVRATANAAADALVLPAPGAPAVLVARTTATPADGRANDAILTLIARALGRPRGALTLVRGHTARDKLIAIA